MSEHLASGECPDWAGAEVGEAIPFYSATAPYPLAYEFSIVKDGAPQGSILCGATEGTAAVIGYAPEGKSVAAALREAVEEELDRPIETKRRYLYGGGSQFGIEVRPVDSVNLPMDSETLTVLPEEGVILYSFTFVPRSRYDWENRFRADFRVSREWIEHEREVRADLLLQPVRRKIETNASKPKVKKGNLGTSGFAKFYQEKLKWSNGKCSTGCTPVAAAIVFEFWDRNGYPKMIGSDSKNKSHSSPTDPAVLDALKTLRKEMGTVCNSDGAGATSNYGASKGSKAYARGRGYKNSSTNNNSSREWSTIIDEIDAGRPPLLSFTGDLMMTGVIGDHTVVPYKYTNSSDNSDDIVCVRTGWKQPYEWCIGVNSPTEEWNMVTTIRPKK
ncbi:MAG TPA: C39 family peptidase [Thermoanaerobaculia bacterium]|nr:C39 family peptidase [Thermoanaerobaculia bacterium]